LPEITIVSMQEVLCITTQVLERLNNRNSAKSNMHLHVQSFCQQTSRPSTVLEWTRSEFECEWSSICYGNCSQVLNHGRNDDDCIIYMLASGLNYSRCNVCRRNGILPIFVFVIVWNELDWVNLFQHFLNNKLLLIGWSRTQ